MKMEIAMLAGAETKKFLVDFTKLVERMEKAIGGKKGNTAAVEEDTNDEYALEATDEEVDTTTDELESFDDIETTDEEETEEPPPKAKGKKAISEKDVHTAALEKMRAINKKKPGTGRKTIEAIFAKFKAKTVSEIKEEHRAKAIAAINALKA